MTKRAIVRPPGTNFNRCLSTHPLHHTLNYELALEQHERYCNTLRNLGLEIIKLEPDNEHPDACFVEDTVVVCRDRALITRMAKESRRGESEQVEAVLSEYKKISSVSAPGTLEGGDVIHLPDSLICGLTKRTNREGALQMETWLKTRVHCIEDPNIMHIKSHVTYLDKNTIIINPKYEGDPVLEKFTKLLLPRKESNSENTLTVNDVVIMSHRHTQSAQLVKEAGFEVIQLNLSEFAKCDGALTCLSIIF